MEITGGRGARMKVGDRAFRDPVWGGDSSLQRGTRKYAGQVFMGLTAPGDLDGPPSQADRTAYRMGI